MERPTVAGLAAALKDPAQEGMMYDQIQGIRNRLHVPMADHHMTRERAIRHSVGILGKIIPFISKHVVDMQGDPGHGQGHLQRDYLHALLLAHDESLPIEYVFPTMIAGTLHDIGTLFVYRYDDKKRAVRHAEVGALIVRAAAIETGVMQPADADLAAYCIAAHTHYLKADQVECLDGKVRGIAPYPDMDGDSPRLEVWLPRWIDRLDCSGPCMVGRHYLTLQHDHEDFGGEHGFYKVSFAEHMRPLFRTPEEIKAAGGKQAMTEHLRMFADSQTNESPYGKHDRGLMIDLRDSYRTMLDRILAEVANPTLDVDVKKISLAWQLFLGLNIEPSEKGRAAASSLASAFEKLDHDVQTAWANGFATTMREYSFWSSQMYTFLETLSPEYLTMFGTCEDVRKTVCPHGDWEELLIP